MKCKCNKCEKERKKLWDMHKVELLEKCKVVASYGWPFKSIPIKNNEQPKE